MQGLKSKCKKSALVLALATGALMSQAAAACTDEQYIGSICYTAANFCPQNFLPADGRTLNVNQYQALYSLIGNTYGGTPNVNFMLPNLNGRSVIGSGKLANTTYAFGQPYGANDTDGAGTVVLNATQVPAHTHPATMAINPGSTTASLALTGSITNLPFSAVASLPVVGKALIGSSSTTNRVGAISDKAVLTSVGGPSALIYGPAGTTNDRQIGPDNAVSGTASGTVSGSATGGTLNGTASGPLNVALTGTVTVQPNVAGNAPVPVRDPSLALTACISVNGLYPVRP